jgi:transposase
MDIQERSPGDLTQLKQRIRREKDAEQRDRYRVVVLALAGEQTQVIQDKLERRGFVQRWAYAYRDGGIDALRAGKPPGAPLRLTPTQAQALKQRMLAGPTGTDDGMCTLLGKDAQRILQEEFGRPYSLPGVCGLLHRMNLSCLKPRPCHHKNDPDAIQRWIDDAPPLSGTFSNDTPVSVSSSGARTRPASASRARWRTSGTKRARGRRRSSKPSTNGVTCSARCARQRARPRRC